MTPMKKNSAVASVDQTRPSTAEAKKAIGTHTQSPLGINPVFRSMNQAWDPEEALLPRDSSFYHTT